MNGWEERGRRARAPGEGSGCRPARWGYACWDTAIAVIDAARKKQGSRPRPASASKKALTTLGREWDSLAAHRDYP